MQQAAELQSHAARSAGAAAALAQAQEPAAEGVGRGPLAPVVGNINAGTATQQDDGVAGKTQLACCLYVRVCLPGLLVPA